jgi:hypothetical protein
MVAYNPYLRNKERSKKEKAFQVPGKTESDFCLYLEHLTAEASAKVVGTLFSSFGTPSIPTLPEAARCRLSRAARA